MEMFKVTFLSSEFLFLKKWQNKVHAKGHYQVKAFKSRVGSWTKKSPNKL
jgi:hypothetical protein